MNTETRNRVERREDLKLFNITLYRALNFLNNDLNIFKIKNKILLQLYQWYNNLLMNKDCKRLYEHMKWGKTTESYRVL